MSGRTKMAVRKASGAAACAFLAVPLLFGGLSAGSGAFSSNARADEAPAAGAKPAAEAQAAQDVTAALVARRWDPAAARAVAELNGRWFAEARIEDPARYNRQLALLAGLGKYPNVMPLLREHPEAAGLLAGNRGPDSANQLADSLRSAGPDYPLLAGLYLRHADPADAAALAAALAHNRDLIRALTRRGLVGCEAVFVFDRSERGADEYERWVRDTLSAGLRDGDDALASLFQFVLIDGPDVRARLAADADFRARFRQDLWPALERVARGENHALEIYLGSPKVWDLLMLEDGDQFLKDYGLLPAELLCGTDAYPQDLRDTVAEALRRRDDRRVEAFARFRRQPLFFDFLRRRKRMSDPTFDAALGKLLAAGDASAVEKLLKTFGRLSDNALADEMRGPASGVKTWIPFYYTLWEVPKKLLQGREVAGSEWIQALADPAMFLLPEVKIGMAGIDLARPAVETITERVADSVANRAVTDIAAEAVVDHWVPVALREAGMDLAEKKLGKEMAAALSDEGLVRFSVTRQLAKAQGLFQAAVREGATVEVTGSTRFVFSYGRAGTRTLRALGKTQTRLMMRPDGRVYLGCFNALAGKAIERYFNDLAQSLLRNGAMEAVNATPPPAPDGRGGAGGRLTPQQEEAWRKQVSAWWLLNADGLPDAPPSPR